MHTKEENRDFMKKEFEYQIRDIIAKLSDEDISKFRKANVPSSNFQGNIVSAIRKMSSEHHPKETRIGFETDWDVVRAV